MRSRRSPWSVGLLAAGFALSLAAVGCGDDDTTDTGGSGGSGGSSGKSGSGGAAGKTGGTGGSAGKSGSGGTGGGASTSQCVSDTTAVFKDQKGGLSAECISCICDQDAKNVSACSAKASDCWGLIQCFDTNGCTDANQVTCLQAACPDLLTSGGTLATPVGKDLEGDACKAKCVPEETDGGAPDAG